MKGKVYRCSVRSAILYESEAWCLKEDEKANLRTERAICGQKVVDRKTTEEQMDMLGLKETLDRLATANGVRSGVLNRGYLYPLGVRSTKAGGTR